MSVHLLGMGSGGSNEKRNEMKAIVTKYLPATAYRGSRIKATAEGVRALVVSYDDGAKDPHAVAALALCARMGWAGDLIRGGMPDESGNVYVFAQSDRVRNPVKRGRS